MARTKEELWARLKDLQLKIECEGDIMVDGRPVAWHAQALAALCAEEREQAAREENEACAKLIDALAADFLGPRTRNRTNELAKAIRSRRPAPGLRSAEQGGG